MATRIASVDMMTFLLCYKHKVWGANNVYISKWNIGDKLIFKIDGKLVATAEIAGEAYMDDKVIWENGLFWNRVSLKFLKTLSPSNGVIFNELKPLFLEKWGKKYGWVILNKHPLPDDVVEKIIGFFDSKEDEINYYKNIDDLINKTKTSGHL